MKRTTLLVTFIFFFAHLCHAQQVSPVKVTKVQDKALVTLLNSVETTTIVSNDNLAVRLYKVGNPSGSAHAKGTDEITHRFVIAVSSIDDAPEQYLYNVGDFLGPKLLKLAESDRDSFTAIIEHGVYKARKITRLKILLKGVTMQGDAIKN